MTNTLYGVITQAGTPEGGKPQITIETTEEQLANLQTSPYGKQCRIEVLDFQPATTPTTKTPP